MDGILAPGTPQPEAISGFYGPGSTYGWLLVVASTLLVALRDVRTTYTDSKASTLLVAEMTAALFYPLVAAGDLGVKLADSSKDWRPIRAVLTPPYGWIFDGIDLANSENQNTHWDTPPSQAVVFQCMSLLLPLKAVLIGAGVVFVIYFASFLFPDKLKTIFQLVLVVFFLWFNLIALATLITATTDPFGYMMELLVYFNLTFASFFLVPICILPICIFCPFVSFFCFTTAFVDSRRVIGLIRRPVIYDFRARTLWKVMKKLAVTLACVGVGSVALSGPITMFYLVLPELMSDGFFANVPFSLTELDQWAALCSGSITFAFSVYESVPWGALWSSYLDIWRMLATESWKEWNAARTAEVREKSPLE